MFWQSPRFYQWLKTSVKILKICGVLVVLRTSRSSKCTHSRDEVPSGSAWSWESRRVSSTQLVALLANEDVSSQPRLMEVSVASFCCVWGRSAHTDPCLPCL